MRLPSQQAVSAFEQAAVNNADDAIEISEGNPFTMNNNNANPFSVDVDMEAEHDVVEQPNLVNHMQSKIVGAESRIHAND